MSKTKKLNSFEDACKILSIDPTVQPDVSMLPEADGKAIVAMFKLSKISEACWKFAGIKIDWDNYNQYKYYPWFRMGSSGAGFSYFVYRYGNALSSVGSRLVYPTAEIAEEIGTIFIDLYRDLMVK